MLILISRQTCCLVSARTDSSFCPCLDLSPIPLRRVLSGPGGRRPPGKRRISGHPRKLVTAAGRWSATRLLRELGVHPGQVGMGFTQVTSISPRMRATVTSYPTFHCPAMVWMDRKGLSEKSCLACGYSVALVLFIYCCISEARMYFRTKRASLGLA